MKVDLVEKASHSGRPDRPGFVRTVRPTYQPYFMHAGEATKNPVRLEFGDESEGTQRLFRILAPWYEVLSEGRLALCDELGASMHPLMTRRLIELFHDLKENPKGAQLILTTHDTSLLSSDVFRRDQIWFTEKDRSGATDLYSLHDFHPRQDESFQKGYLAGRYGAIPFLGELGSHGKST